MFRMGRTGLEKIDDCSNLPRLWLVGICAIGVDNGCSDLATKSRHTHTHGRFDPAFVALDTEAVRRCANAKQGTERN
jgi:hypothetical protein